MVAKRRPVRHAPNAGAPRRPGRLPGRLHRARETLAAAEAQLQPKLSGLIDRAAGDIRRAAEALSLWRGRLQDERRGALRQLERRLSLLQVRARNERRALGKALEQTVRSTLARLEIPSRRELLELTRRVEALTQKLEARPALRPPPRPRRRSAAPRGKRR